MSQADGLPVPQRALAMLVVMIGIAMVTLDGAIVNVALPTLSRTLHTSAAASVWAINGFQIGGSILLLPAAALGEVYGYRRVYMTGMIVFTLASLACAMAPNLPVLVMARVLQGIGSAGIVSTNGALIRHSMPLRQVGKMIGLNAAIIGISGAAAPSIAAAILALGDWRWLFAINLPFGIAAVALGVASLPRTPGADRPWDFVSAALAALAVGGLIVGLDTFSRGASAPLGIGLLIASAAALITLVRREWELPAPLIPIDLLKIPIIGLSVATSATFFSAQMIGFVTLPFMLQVSMGRTVVQTGLLMTSWPLAGAVAAPISGWLSDKTSPSVLGTMGLLSFALGMALLALAPIGISDLQMAWRMALCGFGFAFYQAPNNRAILLSGPRERSGAAGGLVSSARMMGQSLGAVTAAMLFRLLPMRSANTTGLTIACVMALAAAGISALRAGKALPASNSPSGAI